MKLRSFGLSSLRSFLVGILIALLTTACISHTAHSPNPQSAKPPADECRMMQHAMGETCIPLNPQRLVIIDSQALSYALALNVKPIAVFARKDSFDISYIKNRLKGVEAIPTINREPNLEKILLLNPDLIIGWSRDISQKNYKLLSQISSTILIPTIKTSSGSYDWKQEFIQAATMLNKVEIANQLIDEYRHRAEELKQKMNHQHGELNASYLQVYDGYLLFLSSKDSFSGEILSDVGFQFPPVPLSNTLSQNSLPISDELPISEEALPELDSDVLFIGTERDNESILKKFQQKPLWSQMRAVQKNQVYIVSEGAWRGYNILAANVVLDDIEKYLINMP
ncbi:ABC transporter substrate-binding protein [Gloeocapsopsis sp. IPPAS B-1203]|uniref:ABC transporter substrate-binding protein n=1 Tax=Gloeocapsopsis sp. IPPAS B-1203 TaxID=2049454 RepID=UPI000C198B68|nr:ABC transporter substrate-binding protein [Gloeocapsopsis sp. IPPAS B-1203]PIG94546.1 iron(III) dicitrate ABC transporter substrate-binding protein [Gloeocapsopsis sp. IPPAS B-1203]